MAKRYIIDTNVLIQYPHILARAGSKKIVIPRAVLDELSTRGRGKRTNGITDLIGGAVSAGVRIVNSPQDIKGEMLPSDRNAQRLTGADFDIARIAIKYAEERGQDVPCVVTGDRALACFLSTRGIRAITGSEFLGESKNERLDKKIEKSANDVVSSQKRYLAISFVLGIATSLLGTLAYSNVQRIVSTVSIWGTMVAIPLLGIYLFWYREKFRLSYGVFEFFVGVIIACYVFFPTFNYSVLSVTDGIKILGGLYVIVRGLDNIGKGVEGTRVESIWKRIF
ncbi:MAG: twitching motility protein PilT [Candidatus Aegiribacteria sp.]|nr:twitching motility protein PilT [Candidatus Aegiribacteria sp.]